MKKLISLLLVFVMCFALFAGCANNNTKETEGETSATEDQDALAALDKAKEYIFTMYKSSNGAVTSSDYDVVSVVKVGTVTYAIDWSIETVSGDATCITINKGNTMTTIAVGKNVAEEDLVYKLVGKISDEKGNSVTLSFDHTVPAVQEIDTNTAKVLYYVDGNQFVTSEVYTYTSSSGSTKDELVLTDNMADAMALTIVEGEEYVSLVTSDGKYLYSDGTNVRLVDAEDDYTKFVLEAADGGYYIKCANATYNNNAQYLEVYSGYLTVYGFSAEKTNLYIFSLMDSDAEPPVAEPEVTEPEATENDNKNDSTSTSTGDTCKLYIDSKYVTSEVTQYTSPTSGSTKDELVMSEKASDAVTFTIVQGNGYVSFKTSNGKYLYADGTNVRLVDKEDENTQFVLEEADGGYYIKCAHATYNNNPQYLEIYSGCLTVFGFNAEKTYLYLFELK